MRKYITENGKEFARCEGCKKWRNTDELVGNEETHRRECTQCYVEWRTAKMAQEKELEAILRPKKKKNDQDLTK